jgi:hypothetical protein
MEIIVSWAQDTVYKILYGWLTVKCVQATACEGFVHGKNMCGRLGYEMRRMLKTITVLYMNN